MLESHVHVLGFLSFFFRFWRVQLYTLSKIVCLMMRMRAREREKKKTCGSKLAAGFPPRSGLEIIVFNDTEVTRFHPSIVHIPSKLVHTVVGSSCLRVKRTKHRRYSCCVWHGTQRLTKVSCTALCRCLTEYLLTFNIHPVLSLPTHDIHLYSQCVLTLIIFQHPVLLHLCMSISSCDIYFLTRL